MTSLDPVVVSIAVFVVLLQALAFIWTAVLARRMAVIFAIDAIQVESGVEEVANESGAASGQGVRIRFRLGQTGDVGSPTRELIARTNVTADVPRDVESHLLSCGEVAEAMAERYDARASVMVGVPVYLGLMGTFAGIIVGLLQLSGGAGFTEVSIQAFLSGVLVAMISSLTGVVLMVASTAILMPKARVARDEGMADYLAAIKRELLLRVAAMPAAAGRPSFLTIMDDLAGSMRGFTASIEPQKQLLEVLRQLNLPEVAKANNELLARTQPLLERLVEFDKAVATMTQALQGTTQLVTGVAALMERVKEFETSINALGHKLAVDDTVTMKTVEWIKTQIAAMQARTNVVEQYVNEQDFRLKDFALQSREKIEKLAEQASQTLVEVGDRIAREVQQSAEPERVASLLHHVATLPQILAALNESALRDKVSRQELADSINAVARSAQQLTVVVARLDEDSPGRTFIRWARGKSRRRSSAEPASLPDVGNNGPTGGVHRATTATSVDLDPPAPVDTRVQGTDESLGV